MDFGWMVFGVVPALGYGFSLLGRGPRKKTAPDRLLDHPVRRKLVEAISRLKGLNEIHLKQESGLARGTMRHHLSLLERRGVIRKVSLGRETHYFLSESDAEKADRFARIRNGRTWSVLQAILVDPGIRQKDLAQNLKMTRSVLRGHLNLLLAGGLVQEHVQGRLRRYFPGKRVDQGVWNLFGLEKPMVELRGPNDIHEFRLSPRVREFPFR